MVGYAAGTSTDIDIFEAIRHAVTINVGMAGHRASFEAMIRAIEVNKICPTRGAIYKASEFRLDDIPLAGPTRRCRGENFWIASEKNPPPQGDQNCGPKPPDKWAS